MGFVLIIPRGSISGSAAIRNVRLPYHSIERTPGYQDDLTRKATWIRVGIALGMLALGGLFLALGT